MASSSAGGNSRGNTAKAAASDQISQAVLSTSNLLHLMQQSSPAQAKLIKLPKNLLAKTSGIKNTGQLLEQMPRVISSMDAYMEIGLQRNMRLEINLSKWADNPNYVPILLYTGRDRITPVKTNLWGSRSEWSEYIICNLRFSINLHKHSSIPVDIL